MKNRQILRVATALIAAGLLVILSIVPAFAYDSPTYTDLGIPDPEENQTLKTLVQSWNDYGEDTPLFGWCSYLYYRDLSSTTANTHRLSSTQYKLPSTNMKERIGYGNFCFTYNWFDDDMVSYSQDVFIRGNMYLGFTSTGYMYFRFDSSNSSSTYQSVSIYYTVFTQDNYYYFQIRSLEYKDHTGEVGVLQSQDSGKSPVNVRIAFFLRDTGNTVSDDIDIAFFRCLGINGGIDYFGFPSAREVGFNTSVSRAKIALYRAAYEDPTAEPPSSWMAQSLEDCMTAACELQFNQGAENGYSTGFNNGYNSGFADGEDDGYRTGFDAGQTESLNSTNTFTDMIFSIFEAPGRLIDGMLDFDVLGINIASFVKTLITITAVGLVVALLFKLFGR